MKWLLGLMLVGAVAFAATFVPPRTAARMTARGLRSTWQWLSSLGNEPAGDPAARPQRRSRKAQAAAPPQRRAGREGILLQPPRENLAPSDRAALDDLLERSR
ncbi:MAG TPA: hypothetical protein VFL36_08395 [Myxococcales bacterium]|nr:hypothetical protein [Myxococcales bacterium]